MERTRSLPSSLRLIGLILCGLLLSVHSYSQEVIPEVETVTRDGLIYHQSSTEPLTGIVVSFYENGQLTVRATKTAFDSHNYSGEVAYGCASSTQKEKFTCT